MSSSFLLNKRLILEHPDNAFKTSIDSVMLAATIQRSNKAIKVLDIGFGVGGLGLCYAIANKNAKIFAIEKNKSFYEYAMENIYRNNLSERVNLINDDMQNLNKYFLYNYFDIIVTNPPYYKKGAKVKSNSFLKNVALEESSTNISRWIKESMKFLKPGKSFYMVHTSSRLNEIITAFNNIAGNISVLPISKVNSKVSERLIIKAVKGKKGGMKLYNPFLVHDKDNNYTKEAKNVLYNMKTIEI